MDQIDINLLEAWNRVAARLKTDPQEARRRYRRTHSNVLTRPPRTWCLCIRASDRRLSPWNCAVSFDDVSMFGPHENTEVALERGEPHTLEITGEVIRELCKPVDIPRPGIDWTEAARKLGRHEESLRCWIASGALQARYDPPTPHRKRGKLVPIVWSPSPIDPNANRGQAPNPIWGTLWQSLWERLPEEYRIDVRRVPNLVDYKGKLRQRGWKFMCPGRLHQKRSGLSVKREAADFEYIPCGRRVARLYGPQSVWTIAHQFGHEIGFDLDQDGYNTDRFRLIGRWFPGRTDTIRATGPRSFACHRCWRIRYTSLINRDGWNHFISHLSGGLLYGCEVNRPIDAASTQRRKRFVPHVRPAPRRQQALEGLLAGLTYRQIAARMGISYGTVHAHIKTLYRLYRVHSRAELIACIARGGQPKPPRVADPKPEKPARPRHADVMACRRARIRELLEAGLDYRAIADEMTLKKATVNYHALIIYREQGVSGREELRARKTG